jgi:hypothetical protein
MLAFIHSIVHITIFRLACLIPSFASNFVAINPAIRRTEPAVRNFTNNLHGPPRLAAMLNIQLPDIGPTSIELLSYGLQCHKSRRFANLIGLQCDTRQLSNLSNLNLEEFRRTVGKIVLTMR